MDPITARAEQIQAEESEKLWARTSESAALYQRAVKHMPMGVGSSFQAWDPYPVYLREGKGSRVTDVDGNDYVDFHNGFGCMVVGHAHPKVAEAIEKAARTGTHFAAPTEATVLFAEEICRRFQCESVRFANSGTEATMSAIRVARAATGREHLVKIEGSYHGHHDAVMYSVVPGSDLMGGREAPATTPMSTGIPAGIADYTHVVPFNDLTALSALLDERGSEIACLILEPVMMNIGICQPAPGYLQGLKDLLHQHGALLIFDEVKSGATVAAGGAAERYGVVPDLSCWAKAICGGTPGAAFGGRADVMDAINSGAAQQGTFNGNPLVAAAGLATLTEVLTPDAYTYLNEIGTRLARGLREGDERERDPRTRGGPRREGLRVLPPRALAQLPRLPRDQARALPRLVPVGDEPRDLHDAGRRGAVDALGAAHARGHRPLRRAVRGLLLAPRRLRAHVSPGSTIPRVDTHAEWVARDAAVVWHGFTQMSSFAENSPVIVDHADGHELVDVDGNRYLDAISSLWVTTLGHRVPELDAALHAQIDRGAHTTLLGNGNRVVVELSEALRAVVPVDDAHFLYASDGACAVEQALKIAFQYWVNRGVTGRTKFLAFADAYHGDTIGALSVGGGGFGTDLFDPLALSGAPRARDGRSRLLHRRGPDGGRARRRARGRDHRTARTGRGRDAARRPRRSACARGRVPRARRAAHLRRGRDGLRAYRHAVRV